MAITVHYTGPLPILLTGVAFASVNQFLANDLFDIGPMVPTGYGVTILSARMVGTLGTIGTGAFSPPTITVGYNTTQQTSGTAWSTTHGLLPNPATAGAFDVTTTQDVNQPNYAVNCPFNNFLIGLTGIGATPVSITALSVTFDLVPGACGSWVNPTPGDGMNGATYALFNEKTQYHPHTDRVFQSVQIQMPDGYYPGLDLNDLLGTLGTSEFWSAHPLGFVRANVQNNILRVYDPATGLELVSGSPLLTGVSVMRIGY